MNEDLQEQLRAELAELSLHRQKQWQEQRILVDAMRAEFARRRSYGKRLAHQAKLARLAQQAGDTTGRTANSPAPGGGRRDQAAQETA